MKVDNLQIAPKQFDFPHIISIPTKAFVVHKPLSLFSMYHLIMTHVPLNWRFIANPMIYDLIPSSFLTSVFIIIHQLPCAFFHTRELIVRLRIHNTHVYRFVNDSSHLTY